MKELIDRKDLIETLEPFLEEHCSAYIKAMVLAKIRCVPAVVVRDKEV